MAAPQPGSCTSALGARAATPGCPALPHLGTGAAPPGARVATPECPALPGTKGASPLTRRSARAAIPRVPDPLPGPGARTPFPWVPGPLHYAYVHVG